MRNANAIDKEKKKTKVELDHQLLRRERGGKLGLPLATAGRSHASQRLRRENQRILKSFKSKSY